MSEEHRIEVTKLKRETRMLSEQKKSMQNESNATIRKQDAMIATLSKDNTALKEELSVAEQEMGAVMKSKETITNLQLQYEGYASEIKQEQARVQELDRAMNKLRRDLQKQRESKATTERNSEDIPASQRRIARLENRVQKATNDYDDQLATNAQLRISIDHLTKERKTFAGLRGKLEAEVLGQKAAMADLTERSNAAHEARNEAILKMTALQEKTEKEQTQASLELKELNRVLEHERNLKEFMGKKGRSRQAELEEAEKERKKKEDAAVKPEQLIEEYDTVFNTIKEITGITDNERLVDTFIETEVRNFSLFNLVSELNNNIESLREQISETEGKITQFNEESESTGQQRKKMLMELEERFSITETKKESLSAKSVKSKESVQEIKAAIAEVFTSINCDGTIFSKMLGDKEVAETNVMQYLGLIEQRANELLQQLTMINARATQKWEDEAHRLILENASLGTSGVKDFDPAKQLADRPPAPKGLLGAGPKIETIGTIEPPSVVDDDDDDGGDDVRPLSLEEMRAKVRAGGV